MKLPSEQRARGSVGITWAVKPEAACNTGHPWVQVCTSRRAQEGRAGTPMPLFKCQPKLSSSKRGFTEPFLGMLSSASGCPSPSTTPGTRGVPAQPPRWRVLLQHRGFVRLQLSVSVREAAPRCSGAALTFACYFDPFSQSFSGDAEQQEGRGSCCSFTHSA